MPKLTIITVVYNSENTISQTILSVLKQNYTNLDYLIIDGNSTDGTFEILKAFSNLNIVHEPDNGIYDAMNKGIKLATGDYICFLNAGDTFYSNETLSELSKKINNEDVLYGDTCILSGEQKSIQKAYHLNDDWKTIPYCHQSVFIKTSLLKINLFDLNFTVAADYNQYHNLKKSNASFKKIDQVISVYDNEGFSNKNYKKLLKEYRKISIKNSKSVFDRIKTDVYFRIREFLNKR